uniref:Queuosine 5'-phosphate N-glycosylase/hydrolase n=1 Tax=Amphora coffeiformis TaxID=265554 RepID=A0A7S3P7F6_9STRA
MTDNKSNDTNSDGTGSSGLSGPPNTNNLCSQVRSTCRAWMEQQHEQQHVKINAKALRHVADRLQAHTAKQVVWDEEAWHYQPPIDWKRTIRHERIALYILALDAINFCFWPTERFEYADLASTLSRMAELDHKEQAMQPEEVCQNYLFSPASLANVTCQQMESLFAKHHPDSIVPNDMEDRCRLWNEVGKGLQQEAFGGSALRFIATAKGSAVRLVQLIFENFPGFRDCLVLPTSDQPQVQLQEGNRNSSSMIYFLKRAQICVGDLQAALSSSSSSSSQEEEQNDTQWTDMDQLTTFADYRLPQLLRHWGALEYSADLAKTVDACHTLVPGSDPEISIRAATVVAVEELVKLLSSSSSPSSYLSWTAVQVDWYLWQVGEKMDAAQELAPHHRVRTIYY